MPSTIACVQKCRTLWARTIQSEQHQASSGASTYVNKSRRRREGLITWTQKGVRSNSPVKHCVCHSDIVALPTPAGLRVSRTRSTWQFDPMRQHGNMAAWQHGAPIRRRKERTDLSHMFDGYGINNHLLTAKQTITSVETDPLCTQRHSNCFRSTASKNPWDPWPSFAREYAIPSPILAQYALVTQLPSVSRSAHTLGNMAKEIELSSSIIR